MNRFSTIVEDYPQYLYNVHHLAAVKIKNMFEGDYEKIKIGFERYQDVEIFRYLDDPSPNHLGAKYGLLEAKEKFEEIIK